MRYFQTELQTPGARTSILGYQYAPTPELAARKAVKGWRLGTELLTTVPIVWHDVNGEHKGHGVTFRYNQEFARVRVQEINP